MRGTNRGFTLLELIVTMAIVATLAGLGTLGYRLAASQAKTSAAAADLAKLRAALEEFRVEFGRYPEGLSDADGFLTNAVEGVTLVDPWGEAYRYCKDARFSCRVWSAGPNKANADDDIVLGRAGY